MKRTKAKSSKSATQSKSKGIERHVFNDSELTPRATLAGLRAARAGGFFVGTPDDELALHHQGTIKPRYLDLGTSVADGFQEIMLSLDALRAWKVDEKEPDEAAHDRFRDYIYGALEFEGQERYRKKPQGKPRKGPTLSRQARDLERDTKACERQAEKDPANADKWRARAADCREASKLALETSRLLRDPLKDGSDRRHTISGADRILLNLLNDVTRATGKLPFKVLAPLRKAVGLPYDTRKSLGAFASRYSPPKPRS